MKTIFLFKNIILWIYVFLSVGIEVIYGMKLVLDIINLECSIENFFNFIKFFLFGCI